MQVCGYCTCNCQYKQRLLIACNITLYIDTVILRDGNFKFQLFCFKMIFFSIFGFCFVCFLLKPQMHIKCIENRANIDDIFITVIEMYSYWTVDKLPLEIRCPVAVDTYSLYIIG